MTLADSSGSFNDLFGGITAAFVILFVGIAVISIGLFVWWLVVLIEALKVPDRQWDAAGQSKILYVLLMVFAGIVGTILYLVLAKPELRRVGPPPATAY